MTENQKLREVLQHIADFLLLLPSNDGYDDARYECIESLTEALALPTADHFESTTLEAIIQQYGIDRDDANWLRSLLPPVATQTTEGEILPTAEHPNLSDPAVQKRLAAQWGYVLPTAAPVDERDKVDAERYRWLADSNNYYEAIELISDGSLTEDALGKAIDAAIASSKGVV